MSDPANASALELERAVLELGRRPLQLAGALISFVVPTGIVLLEAVVWVTGNPGWRLPAAPFVAFVCVIAPLGAALWWKGRRGPLSGRAMMGLLWLLATAPSVIGGVHAALNPVGLAGAVQGMMPLAMATPIVLSALLMRPRLPLGIGAWSAAQYVALFAVARPYLSDLAVDPELAMALSSWGEALRRAAALLVIGALSSLVASAFRKAMTQVVAERSERERAEREALRVEVQRALAVAASAAKGEFVASLTHELRTPTHGVLGFADVLANAPELSKGSRQNVGRIVASTQHMLSLIEDALDEAAVAAGRVEVSPEHAPVAPLVGAVVDMVRGTDATHAVALTWELSPELPPSLYVDPRRLKQALINLVRNALKYTQAGSVHIRVGLVGAGRVQFEVSDTGPGLPTNEIDRLFGRFERGPGETADGFGLGLAITQRLVDAMGGTLELENRPGGGARARIGLPLTSQPRAEPVAITRFPDREACVALRAAAQRGDMRHLSASCRALEEANPDMAPFVQRVLGFAAEFDDEAVIALLDSGPQASSPPVH